MIRSAEMHRVHAEAVKNINTAAADNTNFSKK